MNWVLLKNSLLVSGLTMALSGVFGLMAALCLASLEERWRTRLLVVAVSALALPPFLVTNCWLHLLGFPGAWRGWLPLSIVSLGGTIWILSLLTWPITMFALAGTWRRLEAAQLESDPAVGGWALIRGLLLPLSRGALAQAAVLTFVLAVNNFAVPAILQVKVAPAEMWVRFSTNFDTLGALRLSWPLLLAPLLLLLWLRHRAIAWPYVQGAVSPRLFRQQLGSVCVGFCGVGTALICLLTVGLPLFDLISTRRTWSELPSALAAGKAALWSSFWFAAASATVVVLFGCLNAVLNVGRRLPSSKLSGPIGWLLWLPFLVPGVLLGIVLIALFNQPWLWFFYQSSAIVVLAFVLRYLALGWTTIHQASHSVDRELTDAASLDGANRWQIWRYVHWPQLAPQVAAAWYVVFLLCLWDVESLVLIVPPGGETLALRVFNLLHYGHNAQVNALCLALLVLAVGPLAAWTMYDRFGAPGLARRIARQRSTCGYGLRSGSATLAALAGVALLMTSCRPRSTLNDVPLESRLFSRVHIIGGRGVGSGQLNKPRSVAVGSRDNLYVVDMTGRVQRFSPEGTFLLSWQMPQTDLGKPKGMGRDRQGNIMVIEPHYQRLNHYSSAGKLVRQWGQRGTNVGQFMMPRAVAINSHDEIYVSEYGAVERIERFAFVETKPVVASVFPSGSAEPDFTEPQFLNSFGHPGNRTGEFNRPEGLCVDGQDRLYVADSCNHRIQVFDRNGQFLRAHGRAGSGKGELSYPYDICVDSEGLQYVCEFGNSRIQIFDAKDQPLEILGGPGAEPGRFSNPWGLALDSAGNLYVADSQNHRVQKFVRSPKSKVQSPKSKGQMLASTPLLSGSGVVKATRARTGDWGLGTKDAGRSRK